MSSYINLFSKECPQMSKAERTWYIWYSVTTISFYNHHDTSSNAIFGLKDLYL